MTREEILKLACYLRSSPGPLAEDLDDQTTLPQAGFTLEDLVLFQTIYLYDFDLKVPDVALGLHGC
jgi:hypothetical protein